ncbi:DUF1643 domain-containing protein [Pedobacter metabolipauper]|uniref:DUF1643 domain-containing protein n=1 Tax=Pedobacter metabolipauper TaxID=425513 RepID=A0A4R6T493_9SPHI|nr:DUF1643 domain-containing protein [Pedobacter metabolipauper]TDQ12201.1 hypothetical protein ATK78_1335 [Pedobacter metabolipauper]
MELFNSITKTAVISDCKKYRYELSRVWDDTKPKVLFIMHNPSTADANDDDPTIRRCIGFARKWGYGGIYVGNLIPYRCTDPKELLSIPFDVAIGHPFSNTVHINKMADICSLHVLAYGNPAINICLLELFDDRWHYLKLTKAGNPGHPLYLKGDLTPKKLRS